MKKKLFIIGLALVVVLGAAYYFASGSDLQGRFSRGQFSGSGSPSSPGVLDTDKTGGLPGGGSGGSSASADLPDLVIDDISLGSRNVLTIEFSNVGAGDVDADGQANGFTSIYLDDMDSARYNYNWYTLSDTAFYTAGSESTMTGNALNSDGHYVKVCIDAGEDVEEEDESNNCMEVAFLADHGSSETLDPCLAGGISVTIEDQTTTSPYMSVDGSSCNVDSIAAADDYLAYETDGTDGYRYASFWLMWVDSQSNGNDSLVAYDLAIGCTEDISGSVPNHTTNVSSSNVSDGSNNLVERTWYYIGDVALPADCSADDAYFTISFLGADDAGPDHMDDDVFIDVVELYN